MMVLISYDVSTTDNKGKTRLRKVAKECQNHAQRVQNSVFECQVDAAQFVKLKQLILTEMEEVQDSVRLYVLGNRYQNKVEHYGVSPSISVDGPLIL